MGDSRMNQLLELLDLTHPYACYGLAVSLFLSKLRPDEIDTYSEEIIIEALITAIEDGLSHFRMLTEDKPELVTLLRYKAIRMSELEKDNSLVASSGLAKQGKYLYPTIITSEKSAKDTYNVAKEIIKSLTARNSLAKKSEFRKCFAPMTTKINSGKWSQSSPKSSLLEISCSLITALTPLKPAGFTQKGNDWFNAAVIPDLPLVEMFDFIELFQQMLVSDLDGNLMEADLSQQRGKSKINEYKRPRIFNGNYPFAIQEYSLGAVKLLGAIGKWADKAGKIDWAAKVLAMIAGTEKQLGKPIFTVSYDDIKQEQFTHHIVKLSLENKLCKIIEALTKHSRLFSELGTDIDWKLPERQKFYFLTNRFLQIFNTPVWKDFLAIRVEYSQDVEPLFKEYFMNVRKLDIDIVRSARALGQWLNYAAYSVANSEVAENVVDRDKKVKQAKAKILVDLESAAMSAKTPLDMLQRISTRVGRLLQKDLPSDATRFMDATASGEIVPEDALHLLLAYLRLRSE